MDLDSFPRYPGEPLKEYPDGSAGGDFRALTRWAGKIAHPPAVDEALAAACPNDAIFSTETPGEFGEKWAEKLSIRRGELILKAGNTLPDLLLVAARRVEYGRRYEPLTSWLQLREWPHEFPNEYQIQEPEAYHLDSGWWPFELLADTSFEDFPCRYDLFSVQALAWFFEAAELQRNGDPKAFALLFEVANALQMADEEVLSRDAEIEETTRARRTLAKNGADARHAPNRKRAEEIRAWYLANKDRFASLDQAAERARDEFNCSFRTAREHIGRAKKELLSAGRP